MSVCLPARECAQTVAAIVRALAELREAGAIDEIVVVDAASADGTAELAQVPTDMDGTFAVTLDPGPYVLEVPLATPLRMTVTVAADAPTPLLVRVPVNRQAP